MKNQSLFIVLLLLFSSVVFAESVEYEPVADILELEPLETSLYFQTGVFYRLGGNHFLETDWESKLMVSLDVSFLKLDPNRPSWGWGIHSAISDNGAGGLRFAPKAIYRIPFSKPTGSFFEASGGLYLLAFNDLWSGRYNYPGYYAEAGLGINHYSIVLGAEAFSAEKYDEPESSGLSTNYWLGLKASQGHGLLVLGATGIVLGLAVSALVNSGALD